MKLLIRKNDQKDFESLIIGETEESFSYIDLIKAIYNDTKIELEFENVENEVEIEITKLFTQFVEAAKPAVEESSNDLPF